MTNNFGPQQKLISKVRNGAKVTMKDDTPKTPHRRATDHDAVDQHDKTILADTYRELNPAAIQREIQALTGQLLAVTTSKKGASQQPPTTAPATRASTDESTTPATRAS